MARKSPKSPASPSPKTSKRTGSGTTVERIYTDPEPLTGLPWLVGVVTLLLFCGWVPLLTTLFFYGVFYSSTALYLWLAICSTVLLPCSGHWQAFLNWCVFKYWRQYFSFSYCMDMEHLKPDEHKYVLAELPHGIMPIGPLLAGTLCDSIFKGWKVGALTASSALCVPGIKHMFGWMGAEAATKKNFLKILETRSCAVVVGGVAEMYMAGAGPERCLLSPRKGFIRVALQAGSPVVPIYHFGLTQLSEAIGADNSFLKLKSLARKTKMAMLIVYGRWFTPLPMPVPLMMAVGKPVEVGPPMAKTEEGFDAKVDEIHQRFMEAMQETYDQHKGVYGWEDRPLNIE